MANKVTFQKPPEPTFLAQFKQKVGYKETAALSDKFATKRAAGEENESDEDDEMKFLSEDRKDGSGPVVVKLKKNDMTEEEARIYTEFTRRKRKSDTNVQSSTEESEATKARTDDEDRLEAEGKIIYRKPKKESDNKKESSRKSNKKSKKALSKAIQNKSLLSFNDQQEQEELDV